MRTKFIVSEKSFEVLKFMSQWNRAIGTAEISRGLHMSISVTSAILHRLMSQGLVEKTDWGKYTLTLRGRIFVDIFTKKSVEDETLLMYWVKSYIRPEIGNLMKEALQREDIKEILAQLHEE